MRTGWQASSKTQQWLTSSKSWSSVASQKDRDSRKTLLREAPRQFRGGERLVDGIRGSAKQAHLLAGGHHHGAGAGQQIERRMIPVLNPQRCHQSRTPIRRVVDGRRGRGVAGRFPRRVRIETRASSQVRRDNPGRDGSRRAGPCRKSCAAPCGNFRVSNARMPPYTAVSANLEMLHGRRLHFVPVLRAEVHLLQLRFGCLSAGAGRAVPRGAREPRSGSTTGNGSPKRSTWGAARPATWTPGPSRRCSPLSRGPLGRGHHRGRAGGHHACQSGALASGRHQSRQPRGAVVRRGRIGAHRPAPRRGDSGARGGSAALRRHSQFQHRLDRRAAGPDARRAGASRWTGSSGWKPRTSPSTCWRSTRTAGWEWRSCKAARVTARRMCLPKIPSSNCTRPPSSTCAGWDCGATRFRTSRGRASNRATT